MRVALLPALSLLMLSCAKPMASSSAILDGSDCAHAVPVKAIKEEYQWVSIHYPGAKVAMQRLHQCKQVPVDVLDIILPDGSPRSVYFDIRIELQEEEKEFGSK